LIAAGHLDEAIQHFHQALQVHPDFAEAHNNLGLVFLMAGQPEKSLPHFSAALRLKPDLAIAQDNLKRAQRQLEARQK
jgi:tetratricopeptide (TPR) repeat protein